jgi:RNA polymerase sigma factor (sigma-70 family)
MTAPQAALDRYILDPSENNKEAVIVAYLPYVRAIVRDIQNPVPHLVDYEDLVAYGIMGLITSLPRYDPSRGTAFTTWAHSRVKGSALDAVRRLSPNSRTRKVTFSSLPDDFEVAGKDDFFDAVNDMIPSKATHQLVTAIRSLNAKQQSCFLLLMHGLSIKSIASLLGVPPGSVVRSRDDAVKYLVTELAALREDLSAAY